MKRFSATQKFAAVHDILASKKRYKVVCKKYNCSRQSLYFWLKKYERYPESSLGKFKSKYKKGKNHPRSISWKVERKILDIVIKNSYLSISDIKNRLADEGIKVSVHGIHSALVRYGLNTKESRHKFSLTHPVKTLFATAFPPAYRLKVIEEFLDEKKPIAQICKAWKISRPTFYSWLERFKAAEALEGDSSDIIEALARHYKRGYENHRSAGVSARDLVLNLVSEKPELSVHELYKIVPKRDGKPVIGHHAIQNILVRENLNTIGQRIKFAGDYAGGREVKIAPLYKPEIPIYRLRQILAPFASVPRLTWLVTRGQIFLVFIAFFGFYIFKVLTAIAISKTGTPIGIFFASISLTFGIFFFVYSIKYYIATLLVLQVAQSGGGPSRRFGSLFSKILGSRSTSADVNPLLVNLAKVELRKKPFISIHVALYNEKRVVERLIKAISTQKYPNYEVVIADDSTDATTEIAKKALSDGGRELRRTYFDDQLEIFVSKANGKPTIKLIHRFSRSGYKGAALQKALENTDPRAEYISIFDADFVPFDDTLEQFMKSFQEICAGLDKVTDSKIAAVQGYQWHVLNKSQTWITRGVRTEYAGSYVIERAGEQIYGGLKQIAGSVYCIRADILRQFGWGTSITEDLELTLRLYEAGYKVAFTPYIQAPAEAVSTVKRLIRQRMRWAEGASFNVKVMLPKILKSPNMTRAEKFEFAYMAPYYLQAAFFIIGTLSWFISEAVLGSRLPFWTAAFGWSLVFTNLFALPLMNIIGLFLEDSDERDYVGILSFVALSYIVVPFQAYAAIKGFFEKSEGPWFRTPKTGMITDVFGRSQFGRFFGNLFGQPVSVPGHSSVDVKPILAMVRSDFNLLRTINYNLGTNFTKPRRVKWIGKAATIFVLAISLIIGNLVPFVSFGKTPVENKQIVLRGKGKETKLIQAIKLTPEKKQYSLSEEPKFTLIMDQDKMRGTGERLGLGPTQVNAASETQVHAALFYGGEEISTPIKVDQRVSGEFGVTVSPQGNLKPGKYVLQASVAGEGNVLYQGRQDFTWGVLAINTNKSLYLPDETAKLSMAVLNDTGEMVCDAKLTLSIKHPGSDLNDQLSTQNGTIRVNPECSQKGVISKPDYEARYQVVGIGNYDIFLTAETGNGTYSVHDAFEVREQVPFDIERVGPTRIYPPNTYPMIFKIKANRDFVGAVEETVPESLDIREHSGRELRILGRKMAFRVENREGARKLIWDVNWQKGGTYELAYEFNVPDVSPQFYLLGPLRLIDASTGRSTFAEVRRWQIAADTIAFRAAGTVVTGDQVTSIVLTKPTGTANTDVLIAMFEGGGGTGDTYTPPAGWTLINRTDSTTVVSVASYWALGSVASTTFTISQGGLQATIGFILGYTGVDNATPMDATAVGQANASSGTITAPSITTVTANAWLVGVMGISTLSTFSAAFGTIRQNGNFASQNGANIALAGIDTSQAVAGASGTKTVTASIAGVNVGELIALRPAVVPENPFILFGFLPVVMWTLGKFRKNVQNNL